MKKRKRQGIFRTAKRLSFFLGLTAVLSLAGCQTIPTKDSVQPASESSVVSQENSLATTTSSSTRTVTENPDDGTIKAKAEALNLNLATKDYSGGTNHRSQR